MSVSQPSTLLLEECGTFEGAAPEQFELCESGTLSRTHRSPGEAGDRFGQNVQKPIVWIDGKLTLSF